MKKILLDTNFLLVPAQFKIDIFEELKGYELVVLESSLKELEKLASGKGKAAAQANVALEIIKTKDVTVAKTALKGDRALRVYALQSRCTVATNDKKLIKALTAKGIQVIRLRQKKYLTEE